MVDNLVVHWLLGLHRALPAPVASLPLRSRYWFSGPCWQPGGAVARMHIPKLDKRWVVVHGVSQQDIKNAPGQFPKTAGPGQVDNLAVAGHRSPPFFWDLDLLKLDG